MYYFVLKCVCIFSDDCQEYFTSPLQLSNQEWHFHNLIPSVDGMIPLEGICHLKVTGNINWHYTHMGTLFWTLIVLWESIIGFVHLFKRCLLFSQQNISSRLSFKESFVSQAMKKIHYESWQNFLTDLVKYVCMYCICHTYEKIEGVVNFFCQLNTYLTY